MHSNYLPVWLCGEMNATITRGVHCFDAARGFLTKPTRPPIRSFTLPTPIAPTLPTPPTTPSGSESPRETQVRGPGRSHRQGLLPSAVSLHYAVGMASWASALALLEGMRGVRRTEVTCLGEEEMGGWPMRPMRPGPLTWCVEH